MMSFFFKRLEISIANSPCVRQKKEPKPFASAVSILKKRSGLSLMSLFKISKSVIIFPSNCT